jgi:ankyrin repeat protein
MLRAPDAMLFDAVGEKDLAKVEVALAAGADINAANEHRLTPLIIAAGDGNLELTRTLIQKGADVGYTGMHEGSVLMLAAYMGQLDFVELFLASGADVNLAMPEGGETALHMAAVTARTDAAGMLLKAGANPNQHTKSGVVTDMFSGGVMLWAETPLHFGAAYGDETMVKAMLDAGADIHATNAHGERPIHYAGRHHRPKAILNLLK